MRYDALIIGGGPAGMAAAVAARERGLEQVALIEREAYLGGVLPQCVHDGFGLHLFKRSYTGPEYAGVWQERVEQLGIPVYLQTTVLDIQQTGDAPYRVAAVGAPLGGHATMEALSVVVACGCRERTRGQLMIPGTRPAGVVTAGTAQYMINIKNQLPGSRVVILGSGDIGLIMARRLTLEGAEVKMVLGQEATGLLRNHIACIKDFALPIRYGWGVVSLSGRGQLFGVHIAPICEGGSFDLAQREFIRCNALLIACGLIPEREVLAGVWAQSGEGDPSQKAQPGPFTLTGEGSPEHAGLFVCGNARQPMDLVDQVTQEGIKAGEACAAYVASVRGNTLLRPLPKELAAMGSLDIQEPKGSVADVLAAQASAALAEKVQASSLSASSLYDNSASLVPCVLCPTGCIVQVALDGRVSGQGCHLGESYALSEIRQPMRTFTGTVLATNGCLVPVRSAQAVPRKLLMRIAQECKRVTAEADIQSGGVVCTNIANSGVDLIASSKAGMHAVGYACGSTSPEKVHEMPRELT